MCVFFLFTAENLMLAYVYPSFLSHLIDKVLEFFVCLKTELEYGFLLPNSQRLFLSDQLFLKRANAILDQCCQTPQGFVMTSHMQFYITIPSAFEVYRVIKISGGLGLQFSMNPGLLSTYSFLWCQALLLK